MSKVIISSKNRLRSFALLLCLAAIVFVFVFENADKDFQNDSEALAVGPIVAVVEGLEIDSNGYGLGTLESLDNPDSSVYSLNGTELRSGYKYTNYTSQVGLQGFVYQMVARFVPHLEICKVLNCICCFLLVIVIMAIAYQLFKKYGFLFAVSFGITTIMSPWVIDFSRNLYWVEFTWFFPMLLGLLCLNYRDKRKYFYPLFFIAILVKCLCGYEYLSTIMMSGVMFLIIEWICNKKERKQIFNTILTIGLISVFGFLVAYTIHAYIYGSGNILDGFKLMQVDLIEKRTFGNSANYEIVFSDSLNATIFDVLIKYFWSSGRPFDGKFMLFLSIITVLLLINRTIMLKKDSKFEVSLYIVSLLSTLSWLVLGKSHSFIHTHMNFVLFYLGWVQSCIYIIIKDLLEQRELVFNITKE